MTTLTSGQTALITGASSGIGQELAKLFAKDGYNLVLVGRSEDQLHRLADVFTQNYGNDQITVIGKDLAKENAAQELYDEVKAKGITVNVLVNDAGLSTYGKFANETDWETEKDIIHLNTITLTHLTKLYLKEMVQRNEGRVLNLASLVSITPNPLMSVYAATKSYVYNFTASLVNELKGTNVTVTALMPNATDTDFFNKAGAADTKVTDELQDPVMVAKDGYEALMKGEPKVVPGGLKNKMYEVMGHVAPQQAVAGMMRSKMERKPTPEEQRKQMWAWGIGIAAVIVAGVVVAALLTGDDDETVEDIDHEVEDTYDDAADNYNVGKAKHKAKGLLSGLVDAYASAKSNVADTADHLVDEAKDTFDSAKGSLSETADALTSGAQDTLKSGKSKVADVADSLIDGAAGVYNTAKSKVTDVTDSLSNGAGDAYKTAKGKLADVSGDAQDRFADAKSSVSNGARSAYKATEGKAKDARRQAKSRYDDAADEAFDIWSTIRNVVTKVVVDALV